MVGLESEEDLELKKAQNEYLFYVELEKSILDKLVEKIYKLLGFLNIQLPADLKRRLETYCTYSHILVFPSQIISSSFIVGFFSALITILVFILTKEIYISISIGFLGLVLSAYLYLYPSLKYKRITKQKESQLLMVLLYLVMYMRHTPNLELALRFASRNISPPIKLDLLRLMWLLTSGKESSIIRLLDKYGAYWKDKSPYFSEGLQLIISTLYESEESKREELLDKAVEIATEGLYEIMLEYVHQLKSPMDMLYMLGIVLPTLSMAILPLAGAFMSEILTPTMFFTLYNILIPTSLLILGFYILEKRPETNMQDETYLYYYMKKHSSKIKLLSIVVGIIVFYIFLQIVLIIIGNITTNYGLMSQLLGILLTSSLGLAIGVAFYLYFLQYKRLADRIEGIVNDLPAAVFRLGNRIYEGIPAEHAFLEVYKDLPDSEMGKFSLRVFKNVSSLGMSIEKAIFDSENGALVEYPSSLLHGIMKIFSESIKKSQQATAKVLITISRYLMELRKIDRRLKDLLAETTSSMESLSKVIGPAILGLVLGITVLIIGILVQLGKISQELASQFGYLESESVVSSIPVEVLSIFSIRTATPPFVMSTVVGLYLIEITLIISWILSRLKYGQEKLRIFGEIGRTLIISSLVFLIVGVLSSVVLWSFSEVLSEIIR